MKKISEINDEHKIDLYQEYRRVEDEFSERKSIHQLVSKDLYDADLYLSVSECLNQNYFQTWSLSDTYTDVEDMRANLGLKKGTITQSNITEDIFISFLQFAYNCFFQVQDSLDRNRGPFVDPADIDAFIQSTMILIERLCSKLTYGIEQDLSTLEFFMFKESELQSQVEEESPSLADSIHQYQRIDSKGDLTRKAEILCTLYKTLESYNFKGTEFQNLYSDATFLFNKSGIRHSVEADKVAAQTFEKMTEEQKEKWYDNAFDLFLTCTVVNNHYIPLKHDFKLLRRGNKPDMIH
jgi:hypothetical protein